MSNPIVGIGTKLSQGTVVAIHRDGVDIEGENGTVRIPLSQVEELVTDRQEG